MPDSLSAGHRLRVDMHVHTRASFDSLNAPEDILHAADVLGIDRIAITDHNEIQGALSLLHMDPTRVLVGEEVKTREGIDVIGLFLHELIPKGVPAREACERIREQGGVVYIPHPFDTGRSGAGAALLDDIEDLIDVVEVHNARCWRRGLNASAEAWARARGKLAGAGSDAHTIRELGRGFVEVPEFEPNRDSFLGALRAGEVLGRTISSPLCHLASTYAKVRKRLAIAGMTGS